MDFLQLFKSDTIQIDGANFNRENVEEIQKFLGVPMETNPFERNVKALNVASHLNIMGLDTTNSTFEIRKGKISDITCFLKRLPKEVIVSLSCEAFPSTYQSPMGTMVDYNFGSKKITITGNVIIFIWDT